MIAKLQPNRVRRTYLGGGRIDRFTGFAPDGSDGALRPEDWMASTTTAFNGVREIEGEGLGRLEDGRLALEAVGKLPILVKLLDSDERLVIQAHPTVPYARAKLNSPVGKTECWYFLDGTAPDAAVYLGFKPGITRAKWRAAFEAFNATRDRAEGNPLLDLLHRVPVAPGDFVFVSGGVPHAIGGGCFMIELQEPSDLMVVAERFTPSGREIPEKKMHMGLGWDGMYDVYDYEGLDFAELERRWVRRGGAAEGGVTRVLGPEMTDKFSLWRLAGDSTLELSRPAAVVVVTEGEGTLNGRAVRKGDRLVASGERALTVTGELTAVVCA